MSPRFPKEEAPDASAPQNIEDTLNVLHHGAIPFEWKDNEGNLLGPYAPLSHSPIVLPAFWAMAKASYNPQSLKPRNRELAILGVCSLIDAGYVRYCHRPIFQNLGLTLEQYETGLKGIVPEGLTDEEAMAYKLGRILTELRGPLSKELWEEACEKMGKHEVLGTIHIVAGYVYVSMLVNVNGESGNWS